MLSEASQWYVFYTKSRSEKKVFDRLKQSAFETFLPLKKVKKQWSDRSKVVEEPLISSYVFVKVQESRISSVLQTFGIVTCVKYCSKPAVVRPTEIDFLKRMYEYNIEGELVNNEISVNSRVLIENGPFMGMECKVSHIYGKHKLIVEIRELNYKIILDANNYLLTLLDNK